MADVIGPHEFTHRRRKRDLDRDAVTAAADDFVEGRICGLAMVDVSADGTQLNLALLIERAGTGSIDPVLLSCDTRWALEIYKELYKGLELAHERLKAVHGDPPSAA